MSPKDIAAKASIASAITVAGLMALEHFFFRSVLYIYLLYPGWALSLLITGGHGGTLGEERVALVARVTVNIVAYAALYAGLLWLHGKLSNQHHTRSAP